MNARHKVKKTQIGVDLVRVLAAEGDRIFSIDRARELSTRVGLEEVSYGPDGLRICMDFNENPGSSGCQLN